MTSLEGHSIKGVATVECPGEKRRAKTLRMTWTPDLKIKIQGRRLTVFNDQRLGLLTLYLKPL